MRHEVPKLGTMWIVEQAPDAQFSEQDITTLGRYLDLVHAHGKLSHVYKCDIREAEGQACAGFCVEIGMGCTNTLCMIEQFADEMYATKIGQGTTFELLPADILRIRILLAKNANLGWSGTTILSSGTAACSVDKLKKQFEKGQAMDEDYGVKRIRFNCIMKYHPYK